MRNVHRVITIGCVLIGILVLVGTVSAFFSPGIQSTLTLPASRRITPTMGSMQAALPTQPVMKATMSVFVPSPATGLLAQDTFQRNNQRFWGTASDGQTWGGNANSLQTFSIAGHAGMVANGRGAFDATLGQRVTDTDIVFSGSLSLFGPGT